MSLTDRVTRRVDIVVRQDALKANLAAIKLHCSRSRVFAVVKSDAYGHGAVDCASALSDADAFAVVHPNEAFQLRDAGITQPLLVMQGAASLQETQQLAERDCMLVVHQPGQAAWLERVGVSTPVTAWIKTDTGMGRLGFDAVDTPEVARKIRSLSGVTLAGIMSHLASADDVGNPQTQQQIDAFSMQARSLPGIAASLANSAALLTRPEAHLDWVRPGIALYGANPLDTVSTIKLSPVMEVSAPLIAVRHMRRGDGIGYGSDFQCPEDMPVGIAAIGYGDGLPRILTDGKVMISGQIVPIIGRVSMDSIAVDLRNTGAQALAHLPAKGVCTGDRIMLWGEDLSIDAMAESAGTISYELLCSIRGHKRLI